MTEKTYTAQVLEDPNDPEGAMLQFPDEVIAELGWKEGDTLNWDVQEDGSIVISRPTAWVMVDCVSTFRTRYMVETPADHPEYALDTVTMEEAKEFSQEHLGEQIVSHRVVTKEEALAQCDSDNAYTKEWPEEQKVETFFTKWSEQK
jgi:bifunctional DNA-binding transcriptional regulator/antitoxin component of YhaV-PrlF toxin-antitoxin module